MAFTDQAKEDLNTVKDQVWLLYEGLKKIQDKPQSKGQNPFGKDVC
jgi:hypothetical protein